MADSRKRRNEDEDDYSAGILSEVDKFGQKSAKKNTIDSDSEDSNEWDDDYNKKKYDVLKDDDIEGQEEGTVDFDGETKITPFNMADEMEEGYFDGNGMYIWNKKDDVKDSWLDSIDWVKVEHKKKMDKLDEEKEEETPDVLDLYKNALSYLKVGESILKAIKRLGGRKIMTASEKLKQKKLAKEKGIEASSSTVVDKDDSVANLTEIANKIMSATGNMNIYQETFESINYKLTKDENSKSAEDLDMFSDDFVKKEKETPKSSEAELKAAGENFNDEVTWEFKWDDKEDAPIYGPHSSSQMNAWVEDGYFKDGVFVRKHKGEDSKFYTSKRIDFEIYC